MSDESTLDHHEHGGLGRPRPDAPSEAEGWDERYRASDRIWSGEPNGALLQEVADLTPGRVLDVGCGEGADAVWLARKGWDVTAVEVSQVALDRARAHADEAGVSVTWVQAGLLDADLPAASFDLVSAQYPALRHTPDDAAEHALLDAVAPGGLVLVVHHDLANHAHELDPEFDPNEFVLPSDIAGHLGAGWEVEVDETRPRTITGGAGAHHVDDVVLRARRTG